MNEKEKLQSAVSFTVATGYQLDKEAFEFLNAISQTGDPVELMKKVIEKVEKLQEKPLFIGESFLKEVAKESFQKLKEETPPLQLEPPSPVPEGKRTFRPYAKDVDTDIKVIEDPTDKMCSRGTLDDYLEYFQDRFKKIRKILKRRIDVRDATSISDALKATQNEKVKIIGIVTEKRETGQRALLRVEDLKDQVTVLVPRNASPELMKKAQKLLLDQVICVSAVKGRNNLLIADDFIWPDIPQKTPRRASEPVYAALTSDLHVGSKMFMRKEFNLFTLWLNGKYGNAGLRQLASHVKYVVVAGDIVDGVGVYPNQIEELAIPDIYEQYQAASKFLEQIPDYIEVIIIPGNHDACRKALPQPAIPDGYAEPLYEARKIHSFGNPCTISLHGVELLLAHGRSLDDVAATVPTLDLHAPAKAMEILLQSRHLAPIYGRRTRIAPEKQDFMVIKRAPDIFHAGHVHVFQYDMYRGTLVVNSGAWQEQTSYQRNMGLEPTPGVAPIVNLQTLHVTPVSFVKGAF
ncbi:MAG: DNA-directed DNA polymerase II small subunit [Thermoproteota archaeon]|nr:DNA-directed DNA polymerase II small subunit [Thermoproteota archaeon]